jgi:myosin heavy subunit
VLGAYLAGFSEIGAAQRLQNAPDRGGQERSSARAYLAQLRQETKALKSATNLRKLENEQLKKKTEVDKLAEKFDLERIGLMKALNETTDAETKLRIQAKIAILDNNEALAKKINAELEAARKAAELANAFTSASQMLLAQTMKLQTAMDSALNSILARIATAGFKPPESLTRSLPLVDQLRVEKAVEANKALNLSNPAFVASMASERQAVSAISGGGNQFSLSFDTTFTGDRFTQLIAESLQLSQKTGYSTSPAGSINP